MGTFLLLNGIPIKIADGQASWSLEEQGERGRVMDGSLRSTRTALRRQWHFRTPPLDPDTALMVMGLVSGSGHRWSYDSDLYSLKGYGPLDPANPAVATIRNNETGLKYGGAVAVEVGATNLLSSNVATGTDTSGNTTGFTAVGGSTITSSSTTSDGAAPWQASKCLNVSAGASFGVQTNAIAATASQPYRGSVYVYSAIAQNVSVKLRDTVNAIDGTIVTLSVGPGWTRFEVALTVGAGSPQIALFVTGSGNAFSCDGFQIEAGNIKSSWVNGTRANGLLRNDVLSFTSTGRTVSDDLLRATDLTIMAWVRTNGMFTVSVPNTICAIGSDVSLGLGAAVAGTSLLHFAVVTSLTKLQLVTSDGLNLNTVLSGAVWVDQQWNHVAAVVRRTADFGADLHTLKIFLNGGLVQSSNAGTGIPDFSTLRSMSVGESAARYLNGMIDDLVVVPYAITDAGIDYIATQTGRAFSDLPRLEAGGDAIVAAAPRPTVIGELPSGDYVQGVISASTFLQNNRTVEFTLTEV